MDPEQPVSQNTHSGNYSKGCKSVGCMKLVLTSSTYVSAKSVRDDPRKLSLWGERPREYDSVRQQKAARMWPVASRAFTPAVHVCALRVCIP